MSLQDKVVVITGAAGSLGKAVAAAFAEAGARQALLDVGDAGLKATYPQADSRRLLLAANLLDAQATAAAIERIQVQFGRIDALCNIAGGFTMGTPVHATAAADWKKMWDINAQTMIHTVQAIVPKMLAAGGGRIVNVGALGALSGKANMGAYIASKSAVIRLTEAMAMELREQNVNVNCVLPSVIDTPPNRAAMPDADPKRWVAPADLASVIRFLCSDGARAIHGAAIPVVGLS
jgi:NAD(P)-dependent dehydrogenase (short-subunit alcohol dehydrogenase family)